MTATHHRGRVEIDLGHLAPHPRNGRRSLGDLKDLTRSIRDRQSRPRWSCCQPDDRNGQPARTDSSSIE